MTAHEHSLDQIQSILQDAGFYHGPIDHKWGTGSQEALRALINEVEESEGTVGQQTSGNGQSDGQVHSVIASSFADPADVAAYERAKAEGKSDQEAFAVGDNGVGKWNDSTREGSGPSCALPPEEWEQFGKLARGKLVKVTVDGVAHLVPIKDTMPHYARIKNGAGTDLNPDAWALWGYKPPQMRRATWQWA